jgi:hypothetical protein
LSKDGRRLEKGDSEFVLSQNAGSEMLMRHRESSLKICALAHPGEVEECNYKLVYHGQGSKACD